MKLADHGFFLARQPLLGIDIFEKWAAADDKKRFVREMLQQASFRQALYIASPSLYERCLENFGSGTDANAALKPLEEDKLYLALSKYLARAAYRCTPFGMFAASTPGRIVDSSALGLGDDVSPILRIRYDFAVQAKLVNWLMADHLLRTKLRYIQNNSMARHGDKLFYVAAQNMDGRKQYQFNQVECEPHLEALLQLAQRYVPFEELQASLVARAGVSAVDASAYLHQLIDSEILSAEIGITITGDDSFATLLANLDAIGERHRLTVFEEVLQSITAHIGQTQVDWIALFEAGFETLSRANCI
ncbi:MAG: lantibiotic dehydratase, partial [Burkholderiales bacterium]|nr:lantibiotic dehydratase [Burkholderiales bacterium]